MSATKGEPLGNAYKSGDIKSVKTPPNSNRLYSQPVGISFLSPKNPVES